MRDITDTTQTSEAKRYFESSVCEPLEFKTERGKTVPTDRVIQSRNGEEGFRLFHLQSVGTEKGQLNRS